MVIRCGGFRALYGWLGDVWERVRAHKMARAGPPEWRGVGGRVYVEELLCVLARVPISVDMLRETVCVRGAGGRGGCSLSTVVVSPRAFFVWVLAGLPRIFLTVEALEEGD